MTHPLLWCLVVISASTACLKPKSKVKVDLSKNALTSDQATAIEQKIAPLVTKYVNDSKNGPQNFDCNNQEQLITYLFAANGRDEGQNCLKVVDQCTGAHPGATAMVTHAVVKMPEVVALAALCASYDDETASRAQELFEQALKDSDDKDPARKFILFAEYHYDAYNANKLITASSLWNDTQKAALTAFLTSDAGSDSTFDRDGSVRRFVEQELAEKRNSSRYKGMLSARYVGGLRDKSRQQDAVEFMGAHIDALDVAFFTMETSHIYKDFYAVPDVGLRLARDIYNRYEPLTNANWKLPTDYNTYTYTELYNEACTAHLLPAEPLKQLKTLDAQWLNAKVTTADAMSQAANLAKSYPERADLLTFIGMMQMAQGAFDDAIGTFWQAHVACKYYDRAHDAIANAKSLRYDKTHDSYRAQQLAVLEKGLGGVSVPASLPNFVVGYQVLNSDYQTAVNYALKFWFPYIDQLVQQDRQISLIWPATLTSDVPGLEYARDRRLYGDARLEDDITGIDLVKGNSMARLGQLIDIFEHPEDGGATLVHEVAHLFHHTFEAKVGPCIDKLYSAATDRGQFVNAYSMTNSAEYFAVAIETYTSDPTSIQKVDPKLYVFIKNIEAGQLDAVQCPI